MFRLRTLGRWTARLALLVIGMVPALAGAADALLQEAQRFLAAKNPRSAFQLLLPHEPRRAGEVAFDYLLGIAALDAGDPQRAVFALERVLAIDPGYLEARAEIARAYFVLGERQNAQREFRAVRSEKSIPASAAATIDRYLSALEPARTRLSGFVEGSYGFDTNVNSATARNEIGIPALGGAIGVLASTSVSQRDSFIGSGAGLALSFDLTDSLALLATVGHAGKYNRHWDPFDTVGSDGSAGLRYRLGSSTLSLAAQGQSFRLDNKRFRDSIGGIAQWQWNVTDQSQLSLFGQRTQTRYPTQPTRDAERSIGGFAVAHAFGGAWSPVLFASGYGGEEQARQTEFEYLGSYVAGGRLGGQLALGPRTVVFANVAAERRRYRADDPFFLTRRLDQQNDYRLGLAVTLADGWSVIPQVAHTDNRSNVELNAFARTLSSVAVRRDF